MYTITEPEPLSVREVAQALGIWIRDLRPLIEAGTLDPYVIPETLERTPPEILFHQGAWALIELCNELRSLLEDNEITSEESQAIFGELAPELPQLWNAACLLEERPTENTVWAAIGEPVQRKIALHFFDKVLDRVLA
jgi:hypothetical protein